MKYRGALHIHTTFSHDGAMSLSAVAELYKRKGFDFICIAEHSQDIGEHEAAILCAQADALSSEAFLVIPGIEYSCPDRLHIAGIGCTAQLATDQPPQVAAAIGKNGGFSILAHPRRIDWECEDELARQLHAMEVWNVRYDGKFIPDAVALKWFRGIKQRYPHILAACGDDLHSRKGFSPAAIVVQADRLETQAILGALAAGRFALQTPLFRMDAKGTPGYLALAIYGILGRIVAGLKAGRNAMATRQKSSSQIGRKTC